LVTVTANWVTRRELDQIAVAATNRSTLGADEMRSVEIIRSDEVR